MKTIGTIVLVSHRVPLVRAGLVAALSSADHLRVRAAAVPATTPQDGDCDVLVTDANSAIEMWARAANARCVCAVRVLIVFHEDARDALEHALRLGLHSYASLATPGPALIDGVEAVARGATFRCPSVRLPIAREGDEAGAAAARPRGGLAPTALRRVRAHIDEHLSEPLALATLAALARLSTGHFARAFRQSVGLTPHRYINLRRIETASARIRLSDEPLAQIARDAGFVDQSHFTRLFAARWEETPSAFRRRHR